MSQWADICGARGRPHSPEPHKNPRLLMKDSKCIRAKTVSLSRSGTQCAARWCAGQTQATLFAMSADVAASPGLRKVGASVCGVRTQLLQRRRHSTTQQQPYRPSQPLLDNHLLVRRAASRIIGDQPMQPRGCDIILTARFRWRRPSLLECSHNSFCLGWVQVRCGGADQLRSRPFRLSRRQELWREQE